MFHYTCSRPNAELFKQTLFYGKDVLKTPCIALLVLSYSCGTYTLKLKIKKGTDGIKKNAMHKFVLVKKLI